MGFLLSTGESMYWKWSVVKSLLLSSKVPANPRLHQCSQRNFLPIAYCLLPIAYCLLEMVYEKPPSFFQSSCNPAAPSVFTVQLLALICREIVRPEHWQEDLGFYLTISVSSYCATTCPHLSRNCSPRTLSRRLILQNGDHHIIIYDYHHIFLLAFICSVKKLFVTFVQNIFWKTNANIRWLS